MIFLQYVFTCTAWEIAMRTVFNIQKPSEVFPDTSNNHFYPYTLSRDAVPLKEPYDCSFLLASTTKFLEARVYDWNQEEEETEAAEGQPLEVTAASGDTETEVLRNMAEQFYQNLS